MKARPGGLLAELLALGGLDKQTDHAMTVSGLDFVLKDGRLAYDDFTLTFTDQFDLKFYGSVGLDETLDLVVSLPVRAALLERLGVRGPVAEYARHLAGSRVAAAVGQVQCQARASLESLTLADVLNGGQTSPERQAHQPDTVCD